MSTSEMVVTCQGVARTFGRGPNAVVAVHDINCQIPPGARIALTGTSGSGKSTLLHLMAGLDTPTAGVIAWPGIGVRSALRPGPVAVIFQGPSLIPVLDVIENVALALLLGGARQNDADRLALESLDRLGLGSLAHRLPEELSGGQAQRVAIARALAGGPRLILADEPTGQLDHGNADTVIDALLAAADHLEGALVITTHDPLVADRLDDIWSLADGELKTPEALSWSA
jgi:ABC-type lipoprotein export system ATPase subunit